MKRIFLFVFILISFYSRSQQWQQMNDTLLEGGYLMAGSESVVYIDSVIVLEAQNGVYISSDLGNNWTFSNSGLDSVQTLSSFAKFNNNIYARFGNGSIYSSLDKGVTWNFVPSLSGVSIFTLFSLGDKLFSDLSYNQMNYSTDGLTWTALPGVLNPISDSLAAYHINGSLYIFKSDFSLDSIPELDRYNIESLIAEPNGHNIYIKTYDTLLYRKNMDNTLPVFDTLYYPVDSISSVTSIRIHPTNHSVLLSITQASATNKRFTKLFRSTDHGYNWTELLNTGLELNAFNVFKQLSNDTLLCNDGIGNIFISIDDGLSWTKRNHNYFNHDFSNMIRINNTLLLKMNKNCPIKGILKSVDNGASWTYSNNGMSSYIYGLDSTKSFYGVTHLMKQDSLAFIFKAPATFFKSVDEGDSWQPANYPSVTNGYFVSLLGGEEDVFFVCIQQDTGTAPNNNAINRFFRTNDQASTWQEVPSISALNPTSNLLPPIGIVGGNDTLVLIDRDLTGTTFPQNYRVFYSIDNGDSWMNISGGILDDVYKWVDYNRIGGSFYSPLVAFGENKSKFICVISTRSLSDYNYLVSDTLYMYESNQWTKLITAGLPYPIDIQSIEFQSGYWYLSSRQGVYSSIDGINWGAGVSQFSTTETEVRDFSSDGLLYGMKAYTFEKNSVASFVSTVGNGIWKHEVTSSINESPILVGSMSVFPNPSSGEVRFRINSNLKKSLFEIYSISGSRVYSESFDKISEGEIRKIDLSKISNGMYFVKLHSDTGVFQEKIIIAR